MVASRDHVPSHGAIFEIELSFLDISYISTSTR